MSLDLRVLYATHRAFVWRNLKRLGVPEARLEDAAQEVFLVVHRHSESFDPARSTAQTWLFGIVLHVAANERRSERRHVARMAPASEHEFWDAVPSTAAGPVELLAERERALLLERALAALPEPGRAMLLLVDLEALPVPRAAERLNVNLNTAYGRLRVARQQFRRVVERLRARQELE